MTPPPFLPPNGSLHGVALDRLLTANLWIAVGLLVVAHLLLLLALLKRRAPSRSLPAAGAFPIANHPSTTDHPGPGVLPRPWLTEALPILACCALFAAMAISSEQLWDALRYQGPSPAAMQVEVVGVQFQWYFRYPGSDAHFGAARPQLVSAAAGNPLGLDPADAHSGDDIVSSVLMLPAGREVDLRLRSQDVIHGFFIPGMRLKQNAVPGLLLHVHFTPMTAGTYPILCTQVCGSGHARMQALLRVVSPEQFAAWLSEREQQAARRTAEERSQ